MEKSYKVIGIFDKGEGRYEHELFIKAISEDEAEMDAKVYAFQNIERLGVYFGAKSIVEL